MPTDRAKLEQLAEELMGSAPGSISKLYRVKEKVKDLLDREFDYDSYEGEAQIFILVCTLYAEHAAQLPEAADAARNAQVDAMIACIRKEDDSHAH